MAKNGTEPAEPDWKEIYADNPTVSFPGSFITIHPKFNQPTLDALRAYHNHETVVAIRVLIEYRDIFGHAHFTKGCLLHEYGTAMNDFSQCKTGNEIDQ